MSTPDFPILPEQDPEQAWFWEPEWRRGEQKASAQIAAGDLTVYDSAEAMFDDIDQELS